MKKLLLAVLLTLMSCNGDRPLPMGGNALVRDWASAMGVELRGYSCMTVGFGDMYGCDVTVAGGSMFSGRQIYHLTCYEYNRRCVIDGEK